MHFVQNFVHFPEVPVHREKVFFARQTGHFPPFFLYRGVGQPVPHFALFLYRGFGQLDPDFPLFYIGAESEKVLGKSIGKSIWGPLGGVFSTSEKVLGKYL